MTHKQCASVLLGCTLVLLVLVVSVRPSKATGGISRSDLSGPWQIALNGRTGCGLVGMLVNVTLDNLAVGSNARLVTHGECIDSTLTNMTFKITSLDTRGSGTANLSCGPGCGWDFRIQVSPDRAMFNLVDVSAANPMNFLGGVAIHQ